MVLAALGVALVSCGGSSRPAGVLFATTQGSTLVDSFGINLKSGVLSQISTGAATASAPGPILLDPTGNFAYVLNTGSNSVSTYTVNSNGTLTAASTSATTGSLPFGMTMDSAGHFLLVANQGSNNVSVFSISNTSLSQVSGSPFATGELPTPNSPDLPAPAGVTVSANNYVYVANSGQDTVSAFSMDPTTGKLTEVAGSPYTVGTAPTGILATTTANNVRVLYVGNEGSNNLSAFVINDDGTLTPVVNSPFSAGLGPVAMAVDPTKNFLYVVDMNSNQVSAYRINTGNGALTGLNPATVSTGVQPVAIAVHPDGLYMYTANVGSDNLSGFSITVQTGVLVPIQTAATSSRPAGVALK
jgi:6-phosphogluconolactonase (cycloisomerase 2 family)